MKCSVNKYRQWMGHKGSVYTLAPIDKQHFISAGSDGYLIKWNMNGEQHGHVLAQVPAQIFCSHYLAENNLLIVGAMNGHMYVIDLNINKCIRNIDLQNGSVFCIESGNNYIYAGTQGGNLFIFNMSFALLELIQVSDKSLRKLAFNNTQYEIFISSSDKGIYIINQKEHNIKQVIRSAEHSVFSLAYDLTHKVLYSGSRDARLYVHRITDDNIDIREIAAHMYTINDLLLNDNAHLLFSASRDKTIKIWDTESLELLKVIDQKFDAHRNSVNKLLYYPEGNLLISASDDRAIIAWHIQLMH
jgi:WD40 repeat protein